MERYHIYVKGNINDNEKVPMTIITSKVLSKQTLEFIQTMKYNDAKTYCSNILGFNLLNGHIN